jgi:hypothetical protein
MPTALRQKRNVIGQAQQHTKVITLPHVLVVRLGGLLAFRNTVGNRGEVVSVDTWLLEVLLERFYFLIMGIIYLFVLQLHLAM